MEALKSERVQIYEDLLSGRIPKRPLVTPYFTIEAACGLAGVDLQKAHYDYSLMQKAYASVCDTFYSDTYPIDNRRMPAVYQMLGAKNWAMSSSGAMQHPEVEIMYPTDEDYDALIEAPYKALIERFLPRVCSELDVDESQRMLVFARCYAEYQRLGGRQNEIVKEMIQAHQYIGGMVTGALTEAPFDFLSDQLRGFKGITMDMRRKADKIEKAVEAIMPLIIAVGSPSHFPKGTVNSMPLHMAPYMNEKQFERFYWPTFEKTIVELDKRGYGTYVIAEQDFTRYTPWLEKLPQTTIFNVEEGDPKHFKATVGRNHVIGGFFDPTITLVRSKEQCLDEAKRIVDICAPDGKFYFAFNKFVMDIKSVDVSKLVAVLDWVSANTNYY